GSSLLIEIGPGRGAPPSIMAVNRRNQEPFRENRSLSIIDRAGGATPARPSWARLRPQPSRVTPGASRQDRLQRLLGPDLVQQPQRPQVRLGERGLLHEVAEQFPIPQERERILALARGGGHDAVLEPVNHLN